MKRPHIVRTKLFAGLFAGLILWLAILHAPAQTTNKFSAMNLNLAIPDGGGSGLSVATNLTSPVGSISAARVRLAVVGEFNGDLYAYLRHVTPDSTNIVILLNRPGRAATSIHGYADAGLDLTFSEDAAHDIHLYGDFTNPPTGSALTGVWQPDGRKISPALVVDSSTRNTSLASFSSMSGTGEWTLFVADLESGGTNTLTDWELEIVGSVVPSVTWLAPADVVYGTALGPTQLNATSPVPGNFTYDPPAGTVLSSGSNQTLSVTFTPTDLSNYVPVTSTVSIHVLTHPLTITANDANKIYGETLTLAGSAFTSSGLVNGDTVTSVTLTSAGTAAAASAAGSPYAIVPSAAVGSGLANYSINFSNGTLTINPANLVGIVTTSQNPALPGESLTLSYTLSAVAPASGAPSGIVRFTLDGTTLANASLSGGVASFTTPSIGCGSHAVVAEYVGDGNFNGATNTLGSDLVINTPPTAVPDGVDLYFTNGVKILIANLLSNDVEADPTDTIQFLSVATTSALGGTVVSTGFWIYYTPPADNTNTDTFTYSIADTLGGSSVGLVTITSRLDLAPSLTLKVTDLTGGNYLIQFDGIPNSIYDIETTATLSPANWQHWTTTNTDHNGMIALIDSTTNGAPAKYYRTVYK